MKTSILFMALALTFVSCKGELDLKSLKKELPVQSTTGSGDVVDTSLSFAGITSATHTDSTMTLNWTAHADAVAYDIYEIVSGVPILKQTAIGQSTATATVTGLTPGNSYTFRVRIRTSGGKSDANTVDETQTLSSVPATPSLLTKVTPGGSSGATGVVKITVSGVKSGDTVKLYSDNTCTTEVASGTATSSTIDLTTTNITIGAHSFAATVTNALSQTSTCSTSTVAFTRTCPTTYGDFIPVIANSSVGTTENFCVMKYEARNNGSGQALSTSAGPAWNTMNQINSRNACAALGTGYTLIKNQEWMTIARDIENTAANWSNGTVGDAEINRGWMAASWSAEGFDNSTYAPSSLANCLYNSGANACAATGLPYMKRTHTLTGNEVIWDIAGNLEEWVDWNVTCNGSSCAKAYYSGDGAAPIDHWYNYTELDANVGGANAITLTSFAPEDYTNFGQPQYMGTYNARSGNSMTAVLRGGTWYFGALGGVYSLTFADPADSYSEYGFRCVYKP